MAQTVTLSKHDFSVLVRILNSLKDIDTSTTDGQQILSDLLSNIESKTRTPNAIRVTGSGTIPGTPHSVSIANVGAANGAALGVALNKGETITFDAGDVNNTLAASSITYDATGTEFLIIYIS